MGSGFYAQVVYLLAALNVFGYYALEISKTLLLIHSTTPRKLETLLSRKFAWICFGIVVVVGDVVWNHV